MARRGPPRPRLRPRPHAHAHRYRSLASHSCSPSPTPGPAPLIRPPCLSAAGAAQFLALPRPFQGLVLLHPRPCPPPAHALSPTSAVFADSESESDPASARDRGLLPLSPPSPSSARPRSPITPAVRASLSSESPALCLCLCLSSCLSLSLSLSPAVPLSLSVPSPSARLITPALSSPTLLLAVRVPLSPRSSLFFLPPRSRPLSLAHVHLAPSPARTRHRGGRTRARPRAHESLPRRRPVCPVGNCRFEHARSGD